MMNGNRGKCRCAEGVLAADVSVNWGSYLIEGEVLGDPRVMKQKLTRNRASFEPKKFNLSLSNKKASPSPEDILLFVNQHLKS